MGRLDEADALDRQAAAIVVVEVEKLNGPQSRGRLYSTDASSLLALWQVPSSPGIS
jgi:hypothetical protein